MEVLVGGWCKGKGGGLCVFLQAFVAFAPVTGTDYFLDLQKIAIGQSEGGLGCTRGVLMVTHTGTRWYPVA